MSEIASKGQLRMSFLRWAMVTVPLVLLLGLIAGRLVPAGSESTWYAALAKPAGTPPDYAFPIAWTTIYVCSGLALAMILHARGARGRGAAIALFVVQMIANMAWTTVFFGFHQIFGALVLLIVILLLVIATALAFGRIRSAAAWLLLPYMVWVSYAAVIQFQIWQLNPDGGALVPAAPATQIEL
ncbi:MULTISPECIES: TspO/MBR family protein [unclassified Sphingomonas]|uniref:TspO/MBR family protein n=1 Tax=unclassified Sphingomonas TaxID=196159 RepID=UPI000830E160|nr:MULTISPECIES: TspO/MBR family protein [unclassified Sphingomonas]